MKNYFTYLWQELYGDPVFRFQSNDPVVNKRMRQRIDFSLVLYGLNTNLRVYKAQFYSPKEARRTLRRITRQDIFFDAESDVFYAQTGAIVAPKQELEGKRELAEIW